MSLLSIANLRVDLRTPLSHRLISIDISRPGEGILIKNKGGNGGMGGGLREEDCYEEDKQTGHCIYSSGLTKVRAIIGKVNDGER